MLTTPASRLLVLAPSDPFPPRDGVQLRLGNLLQRLPEGTRLTLLCPADVASRDEAPLPAPLLGSRVRIPRRKPVRGLLANPLAQALRPEASLIWKFHSPAFAAAVHELSRQNDGVLAVGLQMSQYLNEVPAGTPTALDNYNVESRILERLAETRTGIKRLYWHFEAAKLRRTERRLMERAGTVFAISDIDRDGMARLAPAARLTLVPMGIDLVHLRPPAPLTEITPPRFTFVGAFNWHVNEDAAGWLCREVWPLVREALPDAELNLVGREPSAQVRALTSDPTVKVSGTVADVRPYLWESTAILVPLRYGSGVRTKILEAFAAGRPVVSTPVGAEGLPVTHGRHLLLAEDAHGFAEACIRLVREPLLGRHLSEEGRTLVEAQDQDATRFLHEAIAQAFGVNP